MWIYQLIHVVDRDEILLNSIIPIAISIASICIFILFYKNGICESSWKNAINCDKTILVTGDKGFLGSKLCQLLLKKYKCNIISYDISNGKNILNKEELLKSCTSDIENKKIDLIIHLAAISNLNIYEEKLNVSKSINVQGTRNIIELSENYLKCPILFASTCCLYGDNKLNFSNELSPISPTEPYAKSKEISEIDILDSIKKTNLSHVNMRLATFYGDNMRKALCPAIFIENIYKNKPINIHGTGLQTRTFTFIDDIVNGIICVAKHVMNKPYNFQYNTINITTEKYYDIWDIIKYISLYTNNKKINIEMANDRKSQFDQRAISNQRLCSLGWKSQFTLKQGIKKSIHFFKANGYKWNR